MPTGTLKNYNSERGFGFLHVDGARRGTFVHIRELQAAGVDEPQDGDTFAFDIGERLGKSVAVNIERADHGTRTSRWWAND